MSSLQKAKRCLSSKWQCFLVRLRLDIGRGRERQKEAERGTDRQKEAQQRETGACSVNINIAALMSVFEVGQRWGSSSHSVGRHITLAGLLL